MKAYNPYKPCFLVCALLFANALADALPAEWTRALSVPAGYAFARRVEHVRTWDFPDLTVDFYRQANGPGTEQRVFLAVPKKRAGRCPAIAVPFYYPEAMQGFDPETGAPLPRFAGVTMLADLARRGFVAASAAFFQRLKSSRGSAAPTR